jgi:hypothetical protein
MLSQEQRIILLCISQVTTDLYKKNTPIAGLTVAGSGAGVRRRYRFSISWQVPFTVRASQSISSTGLLTPSSKLLLSNHSPQQDISEWPVEDFVPIHYLAAT